MSKREIIRRDLIEVLKDLPEFCYARNLSDGKPILLKRGSTGYWIAPRPGIDPYAQNERLKITESAERNKRADEYSMRRRMAEKAPE